MSHKNERCWGRVAKPVSVDTSEPDHLESSSPDANGREGAHRRGIQSVENGLRVLSALAACGGPVTLSVVAQKACMSSSQAHRYLSSLMNAGMAKQDAASGLYDMDSGAIRLGLAALARLDVFARADDVFARFAAQTGRTCLLTVWGDAGSTLVRWYSGKPPVITSLAIGSVLPLLRSASGLTFFGFGDPAYMDAEARRVLGEEGAAKTPDLDALRRDIRRAGGARVDNSLIPGLRAVASPVFDLQGRLALVATSIASPVFDVKGDEQAAAALRASCRELTQALGGRWPL